MKKLFLIFTFFAAAFASRAQSISENGQDAQNPNAVNETADEIIQRTVYGRASSRLVPYEKLSREEFQQASNVWAPVEHRQMFDWINTVAPAEGESRVTTDAQAEAFLRKYLIVTDPVAGQRAYVGLDYALTGPKTHVVSRELYSATEKWFALGNFQSGSVHYGGSALCGNFFAPKSAGKQGGAGPKIPFGEKPDGSEGPATARIPSNGGTTNIYVYGAESQITNSGNSQAGGPATAATPPAPTPKPRVIEEWVDGPEYAQVSETRLTGGGQQLYRESQGWYRNQQQGCCDATGRYDGEMAHQQKRLADATIANTVLQGIFGAGNLGWNIYADVTGLRRSRTNVWNNTNLYYDQTNQSGGQAWTGAPANTSTGTTSTGGPWTGRDW